jgi:hypothetical protein
VKNAGLAFVGAVLSDAGSAISKTFHREGKWKLAYELERNRANTLKSMLEMFQMMLEDEKENAQKEREMLYRYMGVLPETRTDEKSHAPRKPIYTYKSRSRKIREAELRSRLDVAASEIAENATTN